MTQHPSSRVLVFRMAIQIMSEDMECMLYCSVGIRTGTSILEWVYIQLVAQTWLGAYIIWTLAPIAVFRMIAEKVWIVETFRSGYWSFFRETL